MAMSERTVTLSGGLELDLCAVSRVAMDEIVSELGGADMLMRLSQAGDRAIKAHFMTYTKAELDHYLDAQRRQLIYCCGWGVRNEPPEDALAALDAMGLLSSHARVTRANWIIYLVDMSYSDKALIIGRVMALTYLGD